MLKGIDVRAMPMRVERRDNLIVIAEDGSKDVTEHSINSKSISVNRGTKTRLLQCWR